MNTKAANYISLFASSSTLICCALPSLFVVLGAGASFASLLTVFPFLITLSQHKVAISLAALAGITLAGLAALHNRSHALPGRPRAGARMFESETAGDVTFTWAR
jgi:hypothetical protein